MTWMVQSFFGLVLDAAVGQVIHGLGVARPSGGAPWYGPREQGAGPDHGGGLPVAAAWEPPATGAVAEAVPQDTGLGGDEVKLVEYAIVSVRRGHERVLPGGSGEELVRGGMTHEGFTAWIIARYPRRQEIPPDDRRFLRVHFRVLTRWPCERPGQGRRIAVLKGIRDALRELPRRPALPAPAVVIWDGTGTPSQVDARGRVTLTKAWNGQCYDVTLEGKLAIRSRSYGDVRHGLPYGYLPVSTDPLAYPCAIQQHATWGDLSGVDNHGGRGIHVRNDNSPGYEGRATLWFLEKNYNGEITLRCTWQTNEATARELLP
ncbi:MAG TPA: hypothetical protein VF173_21780 [Thermoanaerobaculia bacterium]|nr:hypothetical protein [Thermoanaerobaculia bacterium]